MGQLCEIAEVFYKLNDLTVRIIESRNDNPGSTTSPLLLDQKTVFVKYRLDFDNRDYVSMKKVKISSTRMKYTADFALDIDVLFLKHIGFPGNGLIS